MKTLMLAIAALALSVSSAHADRFAIVDTNTGIVNNVIEYPAQPSNPPPAFDANYIAVPAVGNVGPGWTYSGGTFTDPNPPTLSATAQATVTYAKAIAAGLAITSTGSPSISATYPIDTASQSNVTAIASSIGAGMGLPGGGTTLQWADKSGAFHTLTQTQFLAVGAAERDYVYQLHIAEQQAAAGGTPTWPSASVTIP